MFKSRVKSHKSEIRDPNKKGTRKARDVFEILTGIQLHKIKSLKLIRSAIETINIGGPNCKKKRKRESIAGLSANSLQSSLCKIRCRGSLCNKFAEAATSATNLQRSLCKFVAEASSAETSERRQRQELPLPPINREEN